MYWRIYFEVRLHQNVRLLDITTDQSWCKSNKIYMVMWFLCIARVPTQYWKYWI